MTKTGLARRVAAKLGLVLVVLISLHLLIQFLNLNVYDQKQGQVYEISNRLDVDDEASLPTWFNQFLLLAVAGVAWLAARFDEGGKRRAWRLVGLVGLLMSINEVGGIHEFILQSTYLVYTVVLGNTRAIDPWWLMLPLIIGGGSGLLWWLAKTLPAKVIKQFILGGAIYMSGAVGFELLGNDINRLGFMYQGLVAGVEEGMEMLGIIVVIYIILAYVEQNHAAKFAKLRQSLDGRN